MKRLSNDFEELVDAVAEGDLDHWRKSPKGLLASIICTDQFPRNIYRGQAKSFAYDPVALGLARQLVAMGLDNELSPIQRVFAYLPYEHSEEDTMQRQSIELYTSLVEEVEESEREMFAGFLDYAHAHEKIIVRFGRFPHRNAILGRESTAEELEFLSQPGSSF